MTLIEVVVALALLGIIAVTFLGGLTAAARAALLADVRTTAESLARAQMEYVKSQGYVAVNVTDGEALYQKLKLTGDGAAIPDGYSIWSLNRTTGVFDNGGHDELIIAIPWDSEKNEPWSAPDDNPTRHDAGLQRITLTIKHEGKAVFTLEGYKMNR